VTGVTRSGSWTANDPALEAQAVFPSAEIRDECQESQHKRDRKKESPQPTEEPEPGKGQHRWHRASQTIALQGQAGPTEAMYVLAA
jgi:hypothetical protein